MRRSVSDGLPMPIRHSSVEMSRDATVVQISGPSSRLYTYHNIPFHWNPSCSRKNSLNAGSCFKSLKPLAFPCCCCLSSNAELFLLCGLLELALERHICASRPSICLRPFRILTLSLEEMLSKESESSDSIVPNGQGCNQVMQIISKEGRVRAA